MSATPRQRVAAYGVCLREQQILLARYISRERDQRHWTLPGGGIDHGEDPYDAVVREVAEETGYDVAVERLLGINSRVFPTQWSEGPVNLHSVAVLYLVRITGGALRPETGGSTDLAEWVDLPRVAELERTVLIDMALDLARRRPAGGRVPLVPVGGLLRH